MTPKRVLAGLVLAIGIWSCAPADEAPAESSAPAEAARHPVSGLVVVPLTIESGTARHRFSVEVAATPQEQERGLMFRTELGPDEGMIFPSRAPQQRSFWMKNTVIPLDIVFIAPDGRIESVAAEATPYSLEPIPSKGPVKEVLEIAGGRAAQMGIAPGDRVRWRTGAVTSAWP